MTRTLRAGIGEMPVSKFTRYGYTRHGHPRVNLHGTGNTSRAPFMNGVTRNIIGSCDIVVQS